MSKREELNGVEHDKRQEILDEQLERPRIGPFYPTTYEEIFALSANQNQWVTIEAERVLYVDYGRIPILCDRGHSGPVTLIVKLSGASRTILAKEKER